MCVFKFNVISENKNLKIYVADRDAGAVVEVVAVVEVDQAGHLRFRYTRFHYTTKKLFRPYGIITDNQCRVFQSDFNNLYINVLKEVGFKLQT